MIEQYEIERAEFHQRISSQFFDLLNHTDENLTENTQFQDLLDKAFRKEKPSGAISEFFDIPEETLEGIVEKSYHGLSYKQLQQISFLLEHKAAICHAVQEWFAYQESQNLSDEDALRFWSSLLLWIKGDPHIWTGPDLVMCRRTLLVPQSALLWLDAVRRSIYGDVRQYAEFFSEFSVGKNAVE